MTIQEVSRTLNISPDTLRYYERVGMIPPVTRKASGVRDYTELDLQWVRLAQCLRASGLPVQVMTEYVRLFRQGDATALERYQLLLEQQEKLLKQRSQIDRALERLNGKIQWYQDMLQIKQTGNEEEK